jgi:hypothetical protein
VREVTLLSSDHDKYVVCLVDNVEKKIKAGYVYIEMGSVLRRLGNVLDTDEIPVYWKAKV